MKQKIEGAKLALSSEALSILMMIPADGAWRTRGTKKLATIRTNIFKELKKLNKEIEKHEPKVRVKLETKYVLI